MMIVVLAAILIAGIAAVWLIYRAPSSSTPTGTETSVTTESSTIPSTDQTTSSAAPFNTSVLQRSDYSALDLGLITQGRLPVLPPAGAGKANPFQ
ncbi:MAG TPA: hypothetical protein VLG69_02905 [Candidatus Andersenbacteria bacterium]|nr:hypothetical protein [Candidatus Andersenbacteria bacterium]